MAAAAAAAAPEADAAAASQAQSQPRLEPVPYEVEEWSSFSAQFHPRLVSRNTASKEKQEKEKEHWERL